MAAKQVRASHILVENINKAQELMQNIQQGQSFETLAKKHSGCPSGKKGGDLGFFSRGQMVKEFDEVVFSNPVGKVIGPVKTQFGYHIIKVIDQK